MRCRILQNALGLSIAVLLAAHTSAPAADTLPNSRYGTRTAPLLLLGRADVRAELNLTAEQTVAAEREIAALHARAAELKGKQGAEIKAARNEIDRQQQEWLKQSLNDAQSVRLMQIELQWEGPTALARPEIARDLKLEATQVRAIRLAAARVNRGRRPGTYEPAAEERLEQLVSATLTEAQRERWSTMLGPKFRPQFAQEGQNPAQ